MTTHIFVPKRWNRFFAIYIVRLALYVCLKNICDGVGGQDESNGFSYLRHLFEYIGTQFPPPSSLLYGKMGSITLFFFKWEY